MKIPPFFDARKTAQSAAFFISKAGGRLNVLKLIQLMYLSERLSLERYGDTLTADWLVAKPHGPVLSITYDLMQGVYPSSTDDGLNWDKWMKRLGNHCIGLQDGINITSPSQDLTSLSESDHDVLTEIWEKFGSFDPMELAHYTRNGGCPEWSDPNGSVNPISYEKLLPHLGYSEAGASALIEHILEQQAIAQAFEQDFDRLIAR